MGEIMKKTYKELDRRFFEMRLNEFQELSTRTMPSSNPDGSYNNPAKANYAMGLSGEAGEVTDLVKKDIFHGHKITQENVKNEIGDVLHYASGLAKMYGLTLEEVAIGNIAKLKERYPDGFSKEASKNRIV